MIPFSELGIGSPDRPAPMPRKFRWLLLKAVEMLACLGRRKAAPRGVLVVRMDGIGDMILFRQALDHYPAVFGVDKSDITVLGCHSWAGIADRVFDGYRVIAIDEHRFHRRPGYRFRITRQLYRLNVDTVVLDSYFRKPLMADSLMLAARAPNRVTSVPYLSPKTRAQFAYALSRATTVVETGGYPVHETLRHFRFLSAIAGRNITPDKIAVPWAAGPSRIDHGDPYVVFNFGSNEYGRRWPLSSYLETAKWVRERGYRAVFCGAPNDNVHKAEISAALGDDRIVDLIGETSLAGLMDVLAGAAAVLTNDTGPAHLSIALGTPTLVLVGGGHFSSFVPYPETVCPPTAQFLHVEMDCYHCFWNCHLRENDQQSFPCVAANSADRVRSTLQDLLS